MAKITPYLSLATLLCLYLITAVALTSTKVNNNIDVFFAKDDPTYVVNEKIRDTFQPDGFFLLLFEGDHLLQDDFLKKLDRAALDIEKIRHVDSATSLTTTEQIRGTEEGFEVSLLFDPKSDFSLTEQERREKILKDRNAVGMVITEDASAVLLIIRTQNNLDTTELTSIRTQIMEIVATDHLDSSLTAISGGNEMLCAQFKSMIDSQKIFLPLSILISMGLILWMFPRLSIFLMTLIIIGISIQFPVFLMSITGTESTIIHTMIPPLMSALSVALLIHYLNKIKHYSNLGVPAAIRTFKARNDLLKPAFYTSITTAAGLGTLYFSPVPPIQSFGVASAIGVLMIFCLVMFILPPVIARWDKNTPWKQGHGMDVILNNITRFCAHYAIKYAGWVLGITILLMIAGAPLIGMIKIETDVSRFFKDTHPINLSTKKIEAKFGGSTQADIMLVSDELDFFKQPENLKYVLEFEAWLKTLPRVDHVTSATNFIEDMSYAFNGEDEAYRTIPDNRNLIGQYLFIYGGTDLYKYVNYDFNALRVNISTAGTESHQAAILLDQITTYLETHPLEGLQSAEIGGLLALYASLTEMIVETQLNSLLLALVIIFGIMLISFRSAGSALLCMIPNISPLLICFMMMGAFHIWLDIGTAMIAAICVGIAVDDTIHLYHAYNSRRKKGYSVTYSLMRAYQNAGRAVVATTIVLFSEFFVIVASDFLPVKNFGLLSSLSILTALIFDLLVLPAILIVLMRAKIIKN
ncbi:MAG: MMPL family transporter [Rhodospirillales bacterium]|nr:MMPL family transporter [Rhodospirillales bacterium]MCB9964572.1 MMPL family transporter [Rhodospirillales bacterium]MCB9973905.1 MMPL family transporter [Rhodospirillales bacterium]MCB9980530.1 MMPL family transporter [Rhodospirillales bacterium]